MPTGKPNLPRRLLCKVFRNDRFLGYVVTSANGLQLPFRRHPGYTVRVVATSGPTHKDLNSLLKRR